MTGTVTPVITMAAAGFASGQGLTVSPELLATLNTFRTTGFSGRVRTALSQVQGVDGAESIPSALYNLPVFLTGYTATGTDITAQIIERANKLLPAGAVGIQKFSTIMGQSTSFIATSVLWKGSTAELATKNFDSFGLGVNKYSDLVSNGAGNLLSGTSSTTDLTAVSQTFQGLGRVYDTSNMAELGTAANLIKSIGNLGLGAVGNLDKKLAAVGVTDVSAANPVLLKKVLSTITGADLQKIIEFSGMTLQSGSSVTSAADLLDVKKILPPAAAAAIPGGSFAGLGNAMVNIGGQFPSADAAADYVKKIEMPSLPHLDQVTQPVSPAVVAEVTAGLGNGTGPFDTPKLEEMIGTVSGYKHTSAFQAAIDAQDKLLNSEFGDAFQEAMDNLTQVIGSPTTASPTLTIDSVVLEINAVVSDINNSGNLAVMALVEAANAKIVESQNQLVLEAANLSAADIDLDLVLPPNKQSLLNFATQFHSFGVDSGNVGYNNILAKLTPPNQYGDAVKAALIEGRTVNQQTTVGVVSPNFANPAEFLKSQ